MNEKVDVDNVIEIMNIGNSKDKTKDGSESNSPKNEEEEKYHESIINDIYGSMSDSEEDDEDEEDGEPSEEKQKQRLKREARRMQDQMKAKQEKEFIQNAGIGELFNKQMKEKVMNIYEQAKVKYQQQDFSQEKVKGMFNNAFSKFNDIVQKNNVQLPSIAELTQAQPKVHKTSLDQYLKTNQPQSTEQNSTDQQEQINQIEVKSTAEDPTIEKKKTHFQINDGGETNEVSEKESESEGEEFQDSEEEPEKQSERVKEVQDNLISQRQIPTDEEQKTLLTVDQLITEPKEAKQIKRRSSFELNLVKGVDIDVANIKLFQCKKESEKKNVLYQMVFNYETRYLSVINGTLYSFELINTQQTLPFINNKDINTQNIKNLASRFFQSSKTKLFSYGQKQPEEQPTIQQTQPNVNEQESIKKLARLKGKIQLSRLFMIDITERGKKEIEIVMHFVNKNRNPMESPEIKRYRMNVDGETQLFLVTLEESIQRESEYYQIVMKEQAQRRKESE